MRKIENLIGKKFGKLEVVEKAAVCNKKTRWKCVCECGNEVIVYATNLLRGRSKSCNCSRKTINKPKKQKNAYRSAFNAILNNYRQSARKKGYTFSLSPESCYQLFISNCFYCGAPPRKTINTYLTKDGSIARSSYKNRDPKELELFEFQFNGIDRKDNTKGYIASNTVTCCYICNFAKHKQSSDEWNRWSKNLIGFNISSKCKERLKFYNFDEKFTFVDTPTVRNLIYDYKRNAKKRDLSFELSDADCFNLFKQDCVYCGSKPSNVINYYLKKDRTIKSFAKKRNLSNIVLEDYDFIFNGIDRINSSLGYLKNKIDFIQTVPCCRVCNRAKLNLKFTEWNKWISDFSEYQIRNGVL